jgi:putative endonuclease
MIDRKKIGDTGERLASSFLKKKGYRILETNYRCPRGEIDIVARQKECLVFVEVRTKTNLTFGSPEESITLTKMKHLESVANYYLQNHDNLPNSWRLDLIALELEPDGKLRRIEYIENAFEI